MVRNALECIAVDQGRRRPSLRAHVHVHHLDQGRADQVTPAGQDAAGLGSADGLAAAEHHQVSTRFDEGLQVAARRQLRCSVDDDRQAMLVRSGHHHRQISQGIGRSNKQKGRAAGIYGRLDLPGFKAAHTGTGATVVVANVNNLGTGQSHCMVITVAVGTGHEHPVGHGAGVGQGRHAQHIPAGQAGRGGQSQPGGSPRGDDAGLGASASGNHPAGGRLQLGNVDRGLGRLRHRQQHLRGHQAAAQTGQCAGSIDPLGHTQALINRLGLGLR